MTSLEQIVRPFLPVNSRTEEEVTRPEPSSPRVEVGACWGQPSSFEFLEDASRRSFAAPQEEPRAKKYMRIIDASVETESQVVTVQNGDEYIKVARITRMRWSYTIALPKEYANQRQRRRTTYYDLRLVLHPEGETI